MESETADMKPGRSGRIWFSIALGLVLSLASALYAGMWQGAGHAAHAAAASASAVSLQELIDATPEHGILTLENITYQGNVTIAKPLAVVGSGRTVIEGDGTGNVVTITASDVRLERATIRHGSMDLSSEEEYAAVKVVGGSRHTLRDLEIEDAFHGITIKNSDDNEIARVTVRGSGREEIAGQGNGIQLIHAKRNVLTDNTITGTRDGIYFNYADQNVVTGHTISETRYGLHYMDANDNTFTGNRFTRNTGGAAIMLSKNIELSENEFSFHQGTQAFGILLQEGENVRMTGNRFYQNQRGLFLHNAHIGRIADNEFLHNKIGVELWASASEQVFTGNRFIRNVAPVIAVGGRGSNEWSENGIGNLWESEPLLDLNRDGIGDDPVAYQSSFYKLIQENELSYLFMSSPSIGLYEKIHRLLNRQEVMALDKYPLMEGRTGRAVPPAVWWLLLPAAAGFGWVVYGRRGARR